MPETKTRTVSKEECKAITAEIAEAVKDIFEKRGYEAPALKSQYGAWYKLTLQSTPVEAGANGVNLNSPEAQAFLQWPEEYGLEANHLGGTLDLRGKRFVFLGIAPRRTKNPLLFREEGTDKQMLFSPLAAKSIVKPEVSS